MHVNLRAKSICEAEALANESERPTRRRERRRTPHDAVLLWSHAPRRSELEAETFRDEERCRIAAQSKHSSDDESPSRESRLTASCRPERERYASECTASVGLKAVERASSTRTRTSSKVSSTTQTHPTHNCHTHRPLDPQMTDRRTDSKDVESIGQ